MKEYAIEIKWAIIFAVFGLAWMYMEKLLGWHDELIEKHVYYTMLFIVPAVALTVMAILDKRRNFYNGLMTYGQGFKTGFFLTVFITILSPLTQYITSVYITPGYFPNAINYAVSSGQLTQEAAEAYFNVKSYMINSTIGGLIMGTLTSALVAIFTRKSA